MTPPTSNAYYNPLLNEIVFPAGILQPPAFDVNAVDAVNYGAIGVVIGHEISHGFDDQGAQFDAQGRLRNWWTAGGPEEISRRAASASSNQFDGYFIEPGIHHNGKLVLGESIGDLGRREDRLPAPSRSRAKASAPEPTIDGFTPEQQFFIAWGQFRGDEIRPETQRTDGAGRSAPDREVPRDRAAVEPAGVPEGVRVQGRCADGAAEGKTLRSLVSIASRKNKAGSLPLTCRRAVRPGFGLSRSPGATVIGPEACAPSQRKGSLGT